ncbi:MAG: TonB-dependent receptor [Gammaproteobacteria bacterium]|nr:TonB-dependent receptor [Gammaproteobacteria bacterium]
MKGNTILTRSLFLLPAILTVSSIQLAFAQNVPVIVVTPGAIQQPRTQAAIPVTVIDSATIQRSNATNLESLLRGQAGVHVSDLFGDGSQSSIDLRGFGPTAMSNTLILIDGRRLNNSTDTAAPDLSTISLDDIEQIEILQGSAGVLYGNQAVGGVINIIRKKVTQDKVTLSVAGGSYNAQKATASVNKLWGQTQLALTVSDSTSDNYRDHNQSDKQHIALRASRQHSSFTTFVELESTDEFIQTPGALLQSELDLSRTQSLAFYNQDYFDTRTESIRVGFDKHLNATQSINLDASRRVNERKFIQTFRSSTDSLSTPPSTGSLSTPQDRDTQLVSGKYQLRSEQLPLQLLLGVELEQSDYLLDSTFGAQAIDQTIHNLYLSTQWDISSSSQIQAGFRLSEQQADIAADEFDDSVSVFSLGYSWSQNQWKLYVRADQNYRFPTVEEHTNVPFGQAPGLKTQQGLSTELGAEHLAGQRRYRVSVYRIDLDDEIAFDASGFSNLNLDQTTRHGVILEASNSWSQKFRSSLSLTLQSAEITDGAFDGKQLPQVPEKTLRLDGSYQFNSSLLFNLELIAVDKQTLGGDFNNQLEKMPAYQVINTNLAYKINQWDLAFRVNNLLNEKYSEAGSQFTDFSTSPPTNFSAYFPAPERNFWVSAKYTF